MSEGMHTEGVGAFEAGGGVRVGSTGGLQVSSFCMHGDCVAVQFTDAGSVTVANTGDPDERVEFTHAEWEAFIKGAKNGEFDAPPASDDTTAPEPTSPPPDDEQENGMTSMDDTTRRFDGKDETDADRRFFDLRESGYRGPINQDGYRSDDRGNRVDDNEKPRR